MADQIEWDYKDAHEEVRAPNTVKDKKKWIICFMLDEGSIEQRKDQEPKVVAGRQDLSNLRANSREFIQQNVFDGHKDLPC